ncbi:hypothetical protein PTSG_06209 [Salpingoeca rosetta]|uniref:Uncharacterized protein n=1 Tax=Salpingoeca rosetta (strain ATCC 50818 / BSB-021) TaxID=946362 RepID=F2UC90_SALR5|nr:uncharacterized protein PTSG_06209 [Salpingoeca rosetta]EGD74197.1 hypothetical protein PTSG_06209 [Salpingoeca rosetta]|eukprot:XP_004993097.1 hypothetical protein PTSG_06209 [Salpingoeca rosetta]
MATLSRHARWSTVQSFSTAGKLLRTAPLLTLAAVLTVLATAALADDTVYYSLSTASTTITAGTPFTVTVTATYANGTLPADGLDDIYLTVANGTTISKFGNEPPYLLSFDANGQASEQMRTFQSGGLVIGVDASMAAVPTSVGAPLSLTAVAAEASRYVFVDQATITAGEPTPVEIRAVDAYGNHDTTYGPASLFVSAIGSSSGTFLDRPFVNPGSINIANGVGTIIVQSRVLETITISMQDFTNSGVDASATFSTQIVPAPAARYELEVDRTTQVVGRNVLVSLTAFDPYENFVPAANDTLTVVASSNGTPAQQTIQIVNGTATANVTDVVHETTTISLQGPSHLNLTDSATISFVPDIGASVSIVLPTTNTVDTNHVIGVQVRDQYSNIAVFDAYNLLLRVNSNNGTDNHTVAVASGEGAYTLFTPQPQTVELELLPAVGTPATLALPLTPSFFTIQPGETRRFVLLPLPSGQLGQPSLPGSVDAGVNVTVVALDMYGNINTNEQQDVVVTASSDAVFQLSSNATTVFDIANGTATQLLAKTTPGNVLVSLSDLSGSGVDVTSTQLTEFVPGATTKYVLEPLTPIPTGSFDKLFVEAQDQFGNRVPTEQRDCALAMNGSATGAGRVDIVAGRGFVYLFNEEAEYVLASLSDDYNTGLDVSHTFLLQFIAAEDIELNPNNLTTVVRVQLRPEEIFALQANPLMATNIANTLLTVQAKTVNDTFNNPVFPLNATQALQPSEFLEDIAPPKVLSFDIVAGSDTNNSLTELHVHFSEVVNASSLEPGLIALHSAAANASFQHTLTGALVTPAYTREVVFVLTPADVAAVVAQSAIGQPGFAGAGLLHDANSTFLSADQGAFADMNGNPSVRVHPQNALGVSGYDVDYQPPFVVAFSMDLSEYQVAVTFNEPVRKDTFKSHLMTLQNCADATASDGTCANLQTLTLTANYTDDPLITAGSPVLANSSRDAIIAFALNADDADALQRKTSLATSLGDTFLSLRAGAVQDSVGNLADEVLAANALQVAVVSRDTLPPTLLRFSLDLSTNAITFTFSEAVNPASLKPERVILQNTKVNGTTTYQLTGGYISDLDEQRAVVRVNLTAHDVNAIKYNQELATRGVNTYLSIEHLYRRPLYAPPELLPSDFVLDTAGNPVVYIEQDNAKRVRVGGLTRDTEPSYLVDFGVNMDAGTLNFTFIEPLDPATLNISAIALASAPAGASSTRAFFRISNASTVAEIDGSLGTRVRVVLDKEDLDTIKSLPLCTASANGADCFVSIDSTFAVDPNDNPVDAAVDVLPSAYDADVTSPQLLPRGFLSIDLDVGAIVLTFSEPVRLSTIQPSDIVLQSTFEKQSTNQGYSEHTIAAGQVTAPENETASTLVEITMSTTDLNFIKQDNLLCTIAGNCYARFTASFLDDMAGNSIEPIELAFPGQPVQQLLRDEVAPVLESFVLDVSAASLILSFSEIVDPASLDTTQVCLQPTANETTAQQVYCLTESSAPSSTAEGVLVVVVDVSGEDMRAIKARRVGSSAGTTYLSVGAGAIVDTAFEANGVVGIERTGALGARGYIGDVVGPRLAAFDVDLEAAEIRLLFNEPVNVSTFDVGAVVLQSVRNASAAGAGAGTTVEMHRLSEGSSVRGGGNDVSSVGSASDVAAASGVEVGQSWVVVSLSEDDETAIKRQAGLAADAGTSFMWFGPELVADMAGNAVFGIGREDAQAARAHAADLERTNVVQCVLDMQARQLVLSFDDVVDPGTLKVEHVTVQSGRGVVGVGGVVGYTLLEDGGSGTESDVGFEVVIDLAAADVLGLALVGGVGRRRGNSYVSVGAAMLDDIRGNDVIGVPGDRALQVAAYVADTRAPVVVNATLNMTSEVLGLEFSEAVNVSTVDVTALVLQAYGNASAAASAAVSAGAVGGGSGIVAERRLVGGDVSWSEDQERVYVALTKADVDAMKVLEPLVTSAETAFVWHDGTLVADVFGVGSEATSGDAALGVRSFVGDAVPPAVESFVVDMDAGSLSITFTEPVRASTFNGTDTLTLHDGAHVSHIVNNATLNAISASELVVNITLSYEDMTAIKTKRPLCSDATACQMTASPEFVQDMAGNELLADTPTISSALHVDQTPPRLQSFEIDMTTQEMVLTFDEPVLSMSLAPELITLSADNNSNNNNITSQSSDSRTSFTLTGGAEFEPVFDATSWPTRTMLPCAQPYPRPSGNASAFALANCTYLSLAPAYTAVRFRLLRADFDELAGRTALVVSTDTTWLRASSGLALDISANNNTASAVATPLRSASFVADTVQPELLAFSANMTSRQLVLTFSEPVWQVSFNATAAVLKSRSSLERGLTRRLLSNSTSIVGQSPAGTAANVSADTSTPYDWTVSLTVTVQLNEEDIESILSRSFYTSAGNAFLLTDGSVIVDASGNPALPTLPSTVLHVANFTADVVPPQLVSFSLNMTSQRLLFTFDEPVLSISGLVGGITLQQYSSSGTPGERYTLTQGSGTLFEYRNSSVQAVAISVEDANAIKLLTSLATRVGDTHVNLTSGTVTDVVGNPSVAVGAPAMLAASFFGDITPPELVSFNLNMTSEVLSLTFNEPVNTSSADGSLITLAGEQTAVISVSGDGALGITLSGAVVLTPSGLVLEFGLSQPDVNTINWNTRLAMDPASTWLSFAQGMVRDMNGVDVVARGADDAERAALLIPDMIAPELVSFDLNLTSEVLTLTFNEAYNASTIHVQSITLQSHAVNTNLSISSGSVSAPVQSVTLTGGAVFNTHPYPASQPDPFAYTTFSVLLTFDDLNSLKVREGLCVSNTTCFISVQRSLLQDMTGNAVRAVAPTAAKRVRTFAEDTTRPELVNFVRFDLNYGRIKVLFNEIIDVSVIDYTSIALAESFDSTDLFKLTGGSVFSPDVLEVTVNLTVADLNRLKQFRPGQVRICRSRTTCYLRFNATAFADMNANPVQAVPVGTFNVDERAAAFTPDSTPPQLVSFTLDQRVGQLLLTFDETVDGATTDAQRITIQGTRIYNSSNAYTLTGSTLVSDRRDSTLVALELLPADIRQIKAVTGMATGVNDTFIRLSAGAISDMSNNAIQAMAEGLQASAVTTDEANPELVSFDAFDLRDNLLRFTFSEAVEIDTIQYDLIRIISVSNGLGGTVVPLTGGSVRYATTDKTSIEVLLNREDIRSFKLDGTIATNIGNTFLAMGPGVIEDKFGLPSDPVSAFQGVPPDSYVADTSQAVLERVTLDINTAELHLFFDDVVNASTLDPTRIVLQQSAGIVNIVPGAMVPEYYTLQGGSTASPHGFDIVVQLTQHDLNALKRRPDLATTRDNTFVRLQEGALRSVVELQSVVAITRKVDVLVVDAVAPELVDFSLNMTAGTLWLQFSEAINVSTVRPDHIVLQATPDALPIGYDANADNVPPQGDGAVQLTGGTVYGEDIEYYPWPSAVWIMVDLLKVDMDEIKRDVALASSLATTYISHNATFLADMSDFAVVPIPTPASTVNGTLIPNTVAENATALHASAFYPDTVSPRLLAFDIDMNLTDPTSHNGGGPELRVDMFFSEPVDVTTLDYTQLSFHASASAAVQSSSSNNSNNASSLSSYTVMDARTESVNDTSIAFYLSHADIYNIMRIPGLMVNGNTSFIAITSQFVRDMASQPVVPRTAADLHAPAVFVQDHVRPQLSAFDLDMSNRTLDLYFVEPVVPATFNVTQLTVSMDCVDPSVLFGNASAVVNGTLLNATSLYNNQTWLNDTMVMRNGTGVNGAMMPVIVTANVTSSWTLEFLPALEELGVLGLRVHLHESDFNELAWRRPLGLLANTTCLSLTPQLVTDYMSNRVLAVEQVAVRTLVPDAVAPALIGYSLSMDSGNVTLTFTEPIDVNTFNASKLVFLSAANATMATPGVDAEVVGVPSLLDATRIMNDPAELTLTLTRENLDRMQMATSLAVDAASTFLSFASDTVVDMAGNAVVPAEAVALTASAGGVYEADRTPPELVAFDLTMTEGAHGLLLPITVTLEFNEAINASSIDATQLTFNRDHTGRFNVTLADRTPVVRIDARRAMFNLTDADRLAIKAVPALMQSKTASVLSCTSTFARDMAGNAMVPIAVSADAAPRVYRVDLVRPRLVAFDLNMTSHEITLSFDENVSAAAFNLSKISLQNTRTSPTSTLRLGAPALESWQLLSAGFPSTIVAKLSSADVSELELAFDLATTNRTTYLVTEDGVTDDTATNMVFAIDTTLALPVNQYTRDAIAPQLEVYDVNMVNATMHMQFSENVDVSTFDVRSIVLSNNPASPSEVYTLTGGYVSQVNDSFVTVYLSVEDSEYLRATTTLASQRNSTALSFGPSLVRDMAGNPVVPVPLSAAEFPRSFIADSQPPMLVFSEVNVTTGVITLAFSEPVDVNAVNITYLRFLASVADSNVPGAVDFRVSSTSHVIDVDLVTLAVILSAQDLNLLKAVPVCTASDDCVAHLEEGFVADPEGLVVPEAVEVVDVYFEDVIRPRLPTDGFQSIDLDTGVLVLYFDETVNASSLNVSALSLQSSYERGPLELGYSSVDYLQGSVVSTQPSQLIAVQLEPISLNLLKQDTLVCVVKRDCYIYFGDGAILDMNDNPVVGTGLSFPGFVVQQLLRDEVAPVLESFVLDVSAASLILSFSEIVDPASLDTTQVCLQPTANETTAQQVYCLTESSAPSSTAEGVLVVVVDVSGEDMRAIKARRVGSSAGTTYLSVGAGAIVDTAFEANGVVGIERTGALGARGYIGDVVGPRLAAFDVDLEAAEIRLLFNEPVNVSTFDVGAVVLQSVRNASAAGAGAGTTVEMHRLSEGSSVRGGGNDVSSVGSASDVAAASGVEVGQSWVVVSLSEDDETAIKRQAGLAADAGTSFMWFGPELVADMAGNAVFGIGREDAQAARAHAADLERTNVVQCVLDMQARQLVLSFDDVVDPGTLKVEHVTVQSGRGVVGVGGVVGYTLLEDGGSGTESDVGFEVVIDLAAADVLGLALVGGVGRRRGNSYVSVGAAMLDDIRGNDVIGVPGDRALQVAAYVADTRAPVVVNATLNMTSEVLGLEFSEAVNVSTVDVTALVLQAYGNASAAASAAESAGAVGGGSGIVAERRLVGGDVSWSEDQERVYVALTKADVDAMKVLEPLVTSAETAFVWHDGTLVADVFGVGSEATSGDAALGVRSFVGDAVPPAVESFVVDMDAGSLSITFTEPVRANTSRPIDNVLFWSQHASHNTTREGTLSTTNGLVLNWTLDYEDLTALKLRPLLFSSKATSGLSLSSGFIEDMAGNAIVSNPPLDAIFAANFTADATPPQLLGFDVDMSSGTLRFSFDEPVVPSLVLLDGLSLTSRADGGGAVIMLSGWTAAVVASPANAVDLNFTIALNNTLLNLLKDDTSLFTSVETTYVFANAGFVVDAAVNSLESIPRTSAVQASAFVGDAVRPRLLSVTLNMNLTQPLLSLTFSETMNATDTKAWFVSLQASNNATAATASQRLHTSLLSWPNTRLEVVTIAISVADANAMKLKGIGLNVTRVFVSFPFWAFSDMAGNDVVEVSSEDAKPMDGFTPDAIAPKLLGYEIDMDTGEVLLVFDEPVEADSLDVTKFAFYPTSQQAAIAP